MCGIAGILSLRDPLRFLKYNLKKSCGLMDHRGPDDSGYVFFSGVNGKNAVRQFSDGEFLKRHKLEEKGIRPIEESGDFGFQLGICHRRLSIIDVSYNGHQPMSNEDGTVWIAYNGEVYNFLELKKDLKKKHRFISGTDTELLVHLYEEDGVGMLDKLDGMFAFALWDARKNLLFLARDRYGVKPVYYTVKDGFFAFASEIKALLSVPGVSAEVNFNAMSEYFTFQNVFGDDTIFKNIKILGQGRYIRVKNGKATETQYSDICFSESAPESRNVIRDAVLKTFQNSVQSQLISDVPVGAYLSGGMDSGSICAVASKRIKRMATFTGRFDVKNATGIEAGFDEGADAELVSSALKTEHYELMMHSGDLQSALPKVVYHLEELRVGMSYPIYYISRLASRFVKVILSGVGGDEIFAGYPWRYKLVEKCVSQEEFQKTYYAYWSRLVKDGDKKNFFSPETLKKIDADYHKRTFLDVCSKTKDISNPVKKALYFEAKTFLHGLLVIEDKLTMSNSIESRVPFLGNNLVDLASSIPVGLLYRSDGGLDENLSGKIILREAMRKILISEIANKKKQGFSAPERTWYKDQLLSYVKELLFSKRALERGYFNKKYVRRILDEHASGKINHRLLIWSLISWEWWNRIFIDKDLSGVDAV